MIKDEIAALLESGGPARPFDASLLPPFPGARKIAPVRVPMMPRLSGDEGADSRLLIKAYKAACSQRYGKKPRVDRKAAFRMRHAVERLRAHEIVSPYAWAGFRMTQWQYSERRTAPPKIDYVFSKKVVDEHADHFKRKAESYDVIGRVMLTPSHSELLRLWDLCRRKVASPNAGGIGEEETTRIVSEVLPPETYHDLEARVPNERDEIEADLFRRLAAGDWIW